MTRRDDDLPKHGLREDHWHGSVKHDHNFRLLDGQSDEHHHGGELHQPAEDAGETFEAGVPATYGPIVHEPDKTFGKTTRNASR